MALLGTQSSFPNNLYSIGFHHVQFLSGDHKPTRRRYYSSDGTQVCYSRLTVKAVATLEPVSDDKENKSNSPQKLVDDKPQVIIEDDDKELMRRNRISRANRGKEAWNKGVKHSPETLRKIRERTRLAMSSPQVKMKLLKGIHNQTQETRLKIGAAVRLTWDRKRFNRRMIARCHREWLNLLSEASRKGFCGEEELQWDSYNIINQQLGKEFKEGVESRKKKFGLSPGVRAPKTLEQRRKISEAIAAKWADPAYRDRVHSGIAKRHGKDPEARDPEWGTKKKEPKKVKPVRDRLYDPKVRNQQVKLTTSSGSVKAPLARFKDPQARYKLKMIKSIRAQRAVTDPKISEAILRANILIGEAQRAAEALEATAASPMAEASLVETRKLIAEAMSYIKSIEMCGNGSPGDKEERVEGVREIEQSGVNGTGSVVIEKFDEGGLQATVNGIKHIDLSSRSASWSDLSMKMKEDGEKQEKRGKGRRWVCGRLVEDDEDEQ